VPTHTPEQFSGKLLPVLADELREVAEGPRGERPEWLRKYLLWRTAKEEEEAKAKAEMGRRVRTREMKRETSIDSRG
jgi:hypothetical protein